MKYSKQFCPICSHALEQRRTIFDDRYGYPSQYAVLNCSQCKHQLLAIHMNSIDVSRLYTEFYPRSTFDLDSWQPGKSEDGFIAWWRGLKASAFRYVPTQVRVLDIGCGLGESLGYHMSRNCDAHGVEADANILRIADRYGLQVKVGIFDAEEYSPESFDAVTMDQVIEHLSDPRETLRNISEVLKPDGMLIISSPNVSGWGRRLFGSRWIHWHAPYHQHFFSKCSLVKLAEQSGFDVEKCATVTNSAWLGFQWAHLATFPRPGVPSAFWSPRVERSAYDRAILTLIAALNRSGINSLITRLFDIFGIGDNIVCVLRRRTS
jgi:2-polyprenyl-3-methyl-5-hydroxy-6-metoxy-1,4-benzoquinol methylase